MIVLHGKLTCDIEGCDAMQAAEVIFEHQISSANVLVSALRPVVIGGSPWHPFAGWRWACPKHSAKEVEEAEKRAMQMDEEERRQAVYRDYSEHGAALPYFPAVGVVGQPGVSNTRLGGCMTDEEVERSGMNPHANENAAVGKPPT